MNKLAKKDFDSADEVMHPTEKMTVETIEINGKKFRRVTTLSGWRWSVDLKPLIKTDSCQDDHLIYMLSGKMGVRMDSGQELEYDSGDLAAIPPGHDGWVIGSEPATWIDIPH